MDSIAAVTGWPNSPTRATSEASPPASGAAVVTSTGVPASFMACTSRRVLLRSNPTCSMGPGLLPSRLSALTSSVLRGEAPVFMAFNIDDLYAIGADDTNDSEALVEYYNGASAKQRSAMNEMCMFLCGWGLKTIFEKCGLTV